MANEIWVEAIKNMPAIIGAVAGLIAALGVVVLGFLNYLTNKKLNQVHADVNGKMQELVDATGAAKFREGVKSEKDLTTIKNIAHEEGVASEKEKQELRDTPPGAETQGNK